MMSQISLDLSVLYEFDWEMYLFEFLASSTTTNREHLRTEVNWSDPIWL